MATCVVAQGLFHMHDLGCKSKIKADTDKHLENQWRKAKQIVAEVRKDFMPLYANVFNGRLPSGTQLVERMEKLRKAICKIHKARKTKSIPIESDEVKDDDHILVKATGNKEGSWFKPIYAYFTIDVKANKIVEVNAGLNVQ